MNRCAIVLSSFAGLALGASIASASLVVTEVMAQTTSGTASTINGDWWELTNTGNMAVLLGGFQWADTEDQIGGPTPQPNLFPAVSIGAGESIIVLEEAAASEAEWRDNWGVGVSLVILCQDEMFPSMGASDTFSGLSSNGDAVFFYDDAGTLLSSYVFGLVTRGVTFEAGLGGDDLGLSVVGENGAVLGGNGDIGSPGLAVPTPGTAALLALGALGAMRRRVAR